MATDDIDVNGSDELFSHLCLVCKKDKTLTEATVYCEDCIDYYCDKCVDIHKTIPALNDHVLTKASHDGKLPSLPTSRCAPHTKIIDKYCQDHDEVGCIRCIFLKHRATCRNVHDIPKFVTDNKNIVPEFIQEIEVIESELKLRRNIFHQVLTQLQQNKQDVIRNIEATRDKLIGIIWRQTKDTIENVESKYAELNNSLKAKVTDLNNEIDKILKLLNEVRSVSDNASESFVLLNKSKEVVSKAGQLNNDMKHVNISKKLTFDLDSVYEKILGRKVPDLGNVLHSLCLYMYREIKDIDVGRGFMYDSCCTTDGSVFFTNSNVLLLHRVCHKTLKVVETLELSHAPTGVCCVSNTKIAVGLGKTIQMIDTSITRRPKVTDSIEVDHDIRGVDYHDDIFYVTSKDSVYKYDKNGKLLKSFSKYYNGEKIFTNILNLVINPVYKLIHVTDSNNGVITMNQEGHVLNVVEDNISVPWGICVDQHGQVFVSGFRSGNIIQLSCDGRYIETVFSGGLREPRGICFDSTRTRGIFYISNTSTGYVKVYEAEKM